MKVTGNIDNVIGITLVILWKIRMSCLGKGMRSAECSLLVSLFLVIVAVPPRINGSDVIDERSVVIGGSLTLRCPASGEPKPDIEWTRRGEALSFISEPNLRAVDVGRELQLFNAHLLDAGSYMCTATNPAGSASKQFIVKVIGDFIYYANIFPPVAIPIDYERRSWRSTSECLT